MLHLQQCYCVASLTALAVMPANAAESARTTPREEHPGITTTYEKLTLRDGVKLQTILTKPANATGRIPAILFVLHGQAGRPRRVSGGLTAAI